MQREKVSDLCIGRWHGILTALRVDEQYLTNKHGPCPICQTGKDRYRWDNKDGRGTFFCSSCGSGDGFQLLMRVNGWHFVQAAKEVERVIGIAGTDRPVKQRSEADKTEALRRTYKESRPVKEGDPVWIYLKRRTGVVEIPPSIRFHPGLRFDSGRAFPAMLATVTMPDGTASTMHRTWLTADGNKAPVDEPKKVMAGTIKTGAIRLSPVAARLGLAEGIETALRAAVIFGIPVWASISATGMQQWEPPEGVEELIIFGDNDVNFTGQNAAFSLAHRLTIKGMKTEVRIPAKVGTDWADE